MSIDKQKLTEALEALNAFASRIEVEDTLSGYVDTTDVWTVLEAFAEVKAERHKLRATCAELKELLREGRANLNPPNYDDDAYDQTGRGTV